MRRAVGNQDTFSTQVIIAALNEEEGIGLAIIEFMAHRDGLHVLSNVLELQRGSKSGSFGVDTEW
jgi:hypothetical protein